MLLLSEGAGLCASAVSTELLQVVEHQSQQQQEEAGLQPSVAASPGILEMLPEVQPCEMLHVYRAYRPSLFKLCKVGASVMSYKTVE